MLRKRSRGGMHGHWVARRCWSPPHPRDEPRDVQWAETGEREREEEPQIRETARGKGVVSTKGRCVRSTCCDPAGGVRNEAGDSGTSDYQDLGGRPREGGRRWSDGPGCSLGRAAAASPRLNVRTGPPTFPHGNPLSAPRRWSDEALGRFRHLPDGRRDHRPSLGL